MQGIWRAVSSDPSSADTLVCQLVPLWDVLEAGHKLSAEMLGQATFAHRGCGSVIECPT